MNKRRNFFRAEVNWTLQDDDDVSNLVVRGEMSPYIPATGPSMENAGGDPSEGGEIEVITISIKGGRELTDDEITYLSSDDDFLIAVYETAYDDIESNKADIAEARYEAERDR